MDNMETETGFEPEEILPESDNTEYLYEERKIRRREGRFDDPVAMQGALCMTAVIGALILNISKPEIAGEIFERVRELSSSPKELFTDPIGYIIELIKNL